MRIGVMRKGLTFSFGTLQKPWSLLKVPPRYGGRMAFLIPAHAGLGMPRKLPWRQYEPTGRLSRVIAC